MGKFRLNRKYTSILHRMNRKLHSSQPFKRVELKVDLDGNLATIHLGDKNFFIRSTCEQALTHEVYDFAVYGAMAIALSSNLELHSELPISQSCHDNAQALITMMEIWKPLKIYPNPLQLTNVVPDPAPNEGAPGILCMSGGYDSTYSALTMARQENYQYGLLIAGADYSHENNPGYQELLPRVRHLSKAFDMSLIEVETSLRSLRNIWGMVFGLNLAMALHFHSSLCSKGAFSSDLTGLQEISYGPWGNCQPVAETLTTKGFPIHYVGRELPRIEKIHRVYAECPELIPEISICYTDKSIGGNCGRCDKCIRTKISYHSLGMDYDSYFEDNTDLATLIEQQALPQYQMERRRLLAWNRPDMDYLPEGDVKEALRKYVSDLHDSILPTGKR